MLLASRWVSSSGGCSFSCVVVVTNGQERRTKDGVEWKEGKIVPEEYEKKLSKGQDVTPSVLLNQQVVIVGMVFTSISKPLSYSTPPDHSHAHAFSISRLPHMSNKGQLVLIENAQDTELICEAVFLT